MLDAGAEVLETDTFQGSRIKLDEVGLGEHTLEINTKAAEIARKAAGRVRASSPARSARPAICRPPKTRRSAGSPSASLPTSSRAGPGPDRGRRRPDHHRDGSGHPGGQGGHLRRAPRGVRGGRAKAADPGLGLAAATGRQMLLGKDIQAVLTTPCGARGRRDRPQLLDRSRGHARRDPLPRRALAGAGALHPRTPACRCRAPTARRSSPRPPSRSRRCSASSSSASASRSGGCCCGTTPTTSRARRARRGPRPGRAAGARPPEVSSMMTSTPLVQEPRRPGRERVNSQGSRKAKELLCSPTTTTASSRSPRTRSTVAPRA